MICIAGEAAGIALAALFLAPATAHAPVSPRRTGDNSLTESATAAAPVPPPRTETPEPGALSPSGPLRPERSPASTPKSTFPSGVVCAIRTWAIVLALSALPPVGSRADEGGLALDSRVALNMANSLFGDVIVTFRKWPLQDEDAEAVLRAMEHAGFRLVESFTSSRSWHFKPREWPAPDVGRVCAELERDHRIRSLLESCFRDIPLLRIPRPPLLPG